MKRAVGLCIALYLLAASMATAGERRLHGQVLTQDNSNSKLPAGKNIEVVINEIGSSHFTDANGLFDYLLRDRDRPNKEITFQVKIAGYIVQDPLDGQTRIPSDSKLDNLIRLLLVRQGSPLLLTGERFRKSVEEENSKARNQVKLGKDDQRMPVTLTFEEKAARLGFTPEQFRDWILKTANEVEQSDDSRERARSAAAKGNFLKAGDLEQQAMEQQAETFTRAQLKKQQGAYHRSNHAVLRLVTNTSPSQEEDLAEQALELVIGFRFAGDAYYNAYAFNKAVSAYKRALGYVSKEDSPELWATIHLDIGRAHIGVTALVEGAAIHESLKDAFAAFDAASVVFNEKVFPQQWAMIKNYLSNALLVKSNIVVGGNRAQLLAQAVEACEAAFAVFTKEAFPQQWAMTQTSLGLVQWLQGNTTKAIESFKGALTVYTKDTWPLEWAGTQMNLGSVLVAQGIKSGAEERPPLYKQAYEAYQAALTVYTKEALPQQWALTQNNLGNLQWALSLVNLSDLVAQTPDSDDKLRLLFGNGYSEEKLRLLAQAVCRYKAAQTVFTREEFPFYWAMTQVNLGNARETQGLIVSGEDRNRVFAQALEAYEAALTVYTKDALPQWWAYTQVKLGSLLLAKGATTTGILQSWLQFFINWLDLEAHTFISQEGHQLLVQGAEAFRAALTVYTKEALPQQWANTQTILGKSLEFQGKRIGGEAGRVLIHQAIQTFELTLQIWTREAFPVQWEETTASLDGARKMLEYMK